MFKKYWLISFLLLSSRLPAIAKDTQPKGVNLSNSTAHHFEVKPDWKKGEISRQVDQSLQELDQKVQKIIGQSTGSFENLFLAFEQALADFSDQTNALFFLSSVSQSQEIAQEASQNEEKSSQYLISVFMNRKLYQKLKALPLKDLSPDEKKLAHEILESFEDNGLFLDPPQFKELEELKKHLASLETQFSFNLSQDQSYASWTREELAGLSQDYLTSLKPSPEDPKKLIVYAREPDLVEILQKCTQASTREGMLRTFETRAAHQNKPLLKEAVETRRKIAKLLGFKNWADFRIRKNMAKNSKNVLDFLEKLKTSLVKRKDQDLKNLLEFKKKKDPQAKELKSWDIRFYSYDYVKEHYQFDEEKVKEYFPLETVVQGMLKVYSKLFQVQFEAVTITNPWAQGIQRYQTRDVQTGEILSSFYMDLLPRELKYSHAAAFTLISGRKLPNGEYQKPVSAIVANFTSSTGGKPILLKHSEVEVLFHEFGHIMHQTLTRAPYACLSGSSVDRDFVEAPSQMLENWVYDPEILGFLSGHYLRPSEKLPHDLLQKVIDLKSFNQGLFYTRQLLFGFFDLKLHTLEHSDSNLDPDELYIQLHQEILGYAPVSQTHFPESFGHLMGGYDAGYYGYLWSKVYAEDLFSQFEQSGLLNPKIGSSYRKTILERGKMEEAQDLMTRFLGRPLSQDAFYKSLHL